MDEIQFAKMETGRRISKAFGLPEYQHPDHVQFVIDMASDGHTIHHDKDRPSVLVLDHEAVMSRTSVKCQYRKANVVYLVYPEKTDE